MKKMVLVIVASCVIPSAMLAFAEAGLGSMSGTVQICAAGAPKAQQHGPDGEVRNLLGPEVTDCDGEIAGTVTITDLGPGGLKVRVALTKGPVNETLKAYWNATAVANGCHDAGRGSVGLGSIFTNGAGQGILETTLAGGNPFPGYYVHFDIVPRSPGACYTSTWDMVFPSLGHSVPGAAPMPLDAVR